MRGWTGSSGKSPGKDGTTKTTTLEKTLCRSTTTKTTKIPPGRSPNAEEWNDTLKWLDRLVQQSTRQGRNNDNYGTHPNQNNSQKGFAKKQGYQESGPGSNNYRGSGTGHNKGTSGYQGNPYKGTRRSEDQTEEDGYDDPRQGGNKAATTHQTEKIRLSGGGTSTP